ncbi:MAG: ATP-binding cassette domain-containing protein [Fusobacteriaceae bacterium]|nr:ATP-binding cassette domain-containing protein [Fusobacteriaceae bacterium]
MIELKNINKNFFENNLFTNFNYQFNIGQSYALIGQSGCGKTTLLNIIGKLEAIDGGEVIVNNTSLNKIKEKEYFRSYVSYLFQNYGLIENKSIKDNLELSFVGKNITSKEKIKKMLEALEQVNLNLDINRKIFSLSGGESQRVAIAKTILKDTPIILADEPTASLDEKNSDEIMNLILKLQRNRLIIIATHDSSVYERLDHVIELGKEEKI